MIVIAHRGNNKEALENSKKAFDLSYECKANRIEFDIWTAKDGTFIVNHDNDLMFSCLTDQKISELTYDQLKKIKQKDGQNLLTLEDVLKFYLNKIELNIEIKFEQIDAIEDFLAVLKPYKKDSSKIVISSFHTKILSRLKNLDDSYAYALLVEESNELNNSYTFMKEHHFSIFHPYFKLIDKDLMETSKANGWKVYPYTGMIDEDKHKEQIWLNLRKHKIDGLCTNYPRELKTWLGQ